MELWYLVGYPSSPGSIDDIFVTAESGTEEKTSDVIVESKFYRRNQYVRLVSSINF